MKINFLDCPETILKTTLRVVFMFLSFQSFGQGADLKFTELPATGIYKDDNGNEMVKVTGDSKAVNVEVGPLKEDFYYSEIGSRLTERSEFESLDYSIKFKFVNGSFLDRVKAGMGRQPSIGVQFQLRFKGARAERYIYCIISKNGSIIIGRYDAKPLTCKLKKGEFNKLQIVKNVDDWKFIVNGVTISETHDQEPLVVSGKKTGRLVFGANQVIEIESITQEFKNGTLGWDNVYVKPTPRDLTYYQGDYAMSTDCGAFDDLKINIRTYKVGADMFAEVKGISGDVSQIRLEEKESQVYTAAHGLTYIPSLKEYGTKILIDNNRFYFKDFTLREGVIVFTLYFEQEDGVDYTRDKIVSKYKVLDCFFKSK